MIKLGEWWDAREAAFRLAVRTCTSNFEKFLEDDMNADEALYEMGAAIRLLDSIDDDYLELKVKSMTWQMMMVSTKVNCF